jgi:putative IMPACT (imprinted ancient) family translation regulator
MTLVTRVVVQIPYSAYDRLTRMVADAGGRVRDSVFAEDVQLTCAFHTGDEEAFVTAVTDFANGDDICHVGEPGFAEF